MSFRPEDASGVAVRRMGVSPRRGAAPAGMRWRPLLAGLAVLIGGGIGIVAFRVGNRPPVASPPPPPLVTIARPLERQVAERVGLLGQFAAVDRVGLRAQVGGILTEIHFKDGQVVHKGELLFVIDPRPYAIKLEQAEAQMQSATARVSLANAQLWRAQQLKRDSFGTAETVDQRVSQQREAQAALDEAKAAVADAQLELGYCFVKAPFTGKIGAHQVSVGSLVSGSRAGTTATTLLATLVSLDPIHLDFDMNETDYLAFVKARHGMHGKLDDKVRIAPDNAHRYELRGRLDFVDNALDRSSGTIRARATVSNPDFSLTPGEFGRVRLTIAAPKPALLVPDSAVTLDQSRHVVMTVGRGGTVVPKPVETGGLRGGLRVIEAGLKPSDEVIVDGLMHAAPGSKVATQPGTIRFAAARNSG